MKFLKFSSPIGMESLYVGIKLTTNISFKIKKHGMNITLLFEKINPGKPSKIINKQNKIPKTMI